MPRISEQTVQNHLWNIFEKLGVSSRLALAPYAVSHRLLEGGAAVRPPAASTASRSRRPRSKPRA